MSVVDEPLPPARRRAASGRLPLLPTDPPELHLGDLVVPGPTLHTTDSLGRALRAFATGGQPILPVVEGEALVGVLTEQDVQDWIGDQVGRLGPVDPAAARDAMVLHVMRERPLIGYADEPLEAVLPHFEKKGLAALPVLDSLDRFVGMLPRVLALEALTHALRPERVGGMATPFGIFLTTGNQRAGVGDLALAATGALIVLLNVAIMAGLHQVEKAFALRVSAPLEAAAALLVFLVVLRLSPLAGLHAAEHQVVNAVERGEPLDEEAVSAMPREHARCGTNLLGLLFGAQLLLPLIGRDPSWLLLAAVGLMLGWRRIGGFLQRWFTTRPARPGQVVIGLRAGEALLRAYAARPAYRAGRWQRIWNLGVVQVLSGGLATMAALEMVRRAFPALKGTIY